MIAHNGIWDLNTAKTGHKHSFDLANALANVFTNDLPVIDLGCGKGFYAQELHEKGYKVHAYEGTPGIEAISYFPEINELDLTIPFPKKFLSGNVLCLEVGEHIPVHYLNIFIENITSCCSNKLVLSWAVPGQGGQGHVNELPNELVAAMIEKKGFSLSLVETGYLRSNASECHWFQNTILVFNKI